MTAGNGGQCSFRLKAKEKILVQLYLHRCEPDEGVFPFEVTQKGLSDHLGLRRSHVAVALQELVKDGVVEVVKGHVEGADRRQNAYCITPKGVETATSVRERLFEVEVSFEDSNGTSTVKVSEIITSRRASLASVITQLDRGGPVRDEITVMTRPEKRLISVFCPTCKKQIEVDNVFFDEEVGFDCPGCGRPYRIVPALKKEEPAVETARAGPRMQSGGMVAALLTAGIAMALAFVLLPTCLSSIVMIGAGLGLVVWLLLAQRKRHAPKPRTLFSAVAATVVLSPVLLIMWHLTVASIDVKETIFTLWPIWAVMIIAYAGVRRYFPEYKGDFLLASGSVLVLVAAATMFVRDFGAIDVGMALIVGISGAVVIVLSTFHPIDRDAATLDWGLSAGVFLLLLAWFALAPRIDEPIDLIATDAIALLGMVLIGLRVAREVIGSKDLSSHLLSALPLTAGIGLFVIGAFFIKGGAELAGVIELAVATPFAYFGFRQVLNEHWPYRVTLVVVFVAVILLAFVAGLVT